ncbi:MAG: SH3 domain-containing protein [Proteobacteria bacterium]|nr:SH3 domain-containing protein [Pseudomonadota bacterium]
MKKKNITARQKIVALLLGVFFLSLVPAGGASADHRRGRGYMGPPFRHGQVIAKLPHGHRTIYVGRSPYYFWDGIFYSPGTRGYVVVSGPVGAIVASLPLGHSRVSIGGGIYFNFGDTYYRQVPQGYMVVAPPPEVVVQPQPPQIYGSVSVIANRLNVRSGPGREHPVVFQLRQGTILTIYGGSAGWYYVQLPNGQYGWVMERFTTMLGPPAEG